MALKSIKLVNFRSYPQYSFKLEKPLILIVGANGAGKTNLLEAIFVLATTRSWRAPDRFLIRDGESEFKIEGQIGKERLAITYHLTQPAKKALLNDRVQTAARYVQQFQAVLFEPQTLELLTGSPQTRRNWLNGMLAFSNPNYWQALKRHRQVLAQRNSLLRTHAKVHDQLFVWDVGLVESAAVLHGCRQAFINFANDSINGLYEEIAHQKLNLELIYRSSVAAKDYPSALMARLTQSVAQDIRFGTTSHGPHRDDLQVLFKNRSITKIASRGELRTVSLILKLLELKWRQAVSKSDIILLLDDVFSELDKTRRQVLLNQLKGIQTIITATDKQGIHSMLPADHQLISL